MSSGVPSPKRASAKRKTYWDNRKDAVYLHAARLTCDRFAGDAKSVIDVGSNRTPTLEWHRKNASRLVSLDLRRPYVAAGVESITADLLAYSPSEKFDLVTCFQVLEHVPEAGAFARKLLALGKVVVVSVPYRWRKGTVKNHVHDPVDEVKLREWFGREPLFAHLCVEIEPARQQRLIHVYSLAHTKEVRTTGVRGRPTLVQRVARAIKKRLRVANEK